ncbi:MAG: YihY/virulence factor BrkB family protein [Prevotella sp.]|jgi:membrane protein|nr:YihY/virulence factor BrkB family protein [Prevotella sp.]
MIDKIKAFVTKIIRFLTYDIWRINKSVAGESSKRIGFYNIIKAFILAIRNIDGQQLFVRASALTYNTLLSIVPLLAVLFAIASGFGFDKIVKTQLFSYFAGQEEILNKGMALIDTSIEYAKSGVFAGIGVVMLLYTVINLLSGIEDNFNRIWQVKKGRTYFRMFTDYLALIIIAPIFLICNAGVTVLLNTTAEQQYLLGLVISPFLKMVPFLITILLFTILYIYIPNTKVKFRSALLGGVFTGICFQVFQMLYISGQIWISKYNAIYGTFAALPLLLLWLQMTWFFILFGVQLSFAFQNVGKFDFEHETSHITRRYRDFVILVIMTLIIKRFENGEKPYTADDLSEQYKIPTSLTNDTLFYLQEVNLVAETPSDKDLVSAYIPAMDINQITVGKLFEKIYEYGSEDFVIDKNNTFQSEWNTIINMENVLNSDQGQVLLKDL